MPPKATRKAPSSRASQTQGTLAFSGAQNKITKPAASTSSRSTAKKNLKAAAAAASAAFPVEVIEQSPEPPTTTDTTTTTPANLTLLPKPTTSPSQPALTPLETTALRLPPSALKSYWSHKESSRLHPRVHQSSLSLHEKILREFDLTASYGPCIGIPRMKRWHRAEGLGLGPPIEVLGVLVRERELVGQGKGGGMERAAMEGLVGGG